MELKSAPHNAESGAKVLCLMKHLGRDCCKLAMPFLCWMGRLVGYGFGNCVEGPLLECLDLFVVRGIRCTDLIEDASTNTGSRAYIAKYAFMIYLHG